MRVVVTDYDFEDLRIEREAFESIGAEVVGADAETEEEVREAVEGADALLNQYAPIGPAAFDAAPDLRAVGRYGVGVDTVDIDAATERGVWVLNVPDYCEDEVSTHALALLLACERRIARFDSAIEDGEWDWKGGRPIYRQRGRTLGLAGFGTIPQRLAEKAAALGLQVIAYDPYVDREELAEHGVEKVDFDALLGRADAISVHTPLTDETRELFDREAFDAMDEESVIVNTARGAVIDVEALAAALEEDEIRAAGLDVLPEEPPDESPLVGRDDVVLTPHVGWYSEESLVDLRRTIAEDVARVLEGEEPENPVNEL